jgi:hypothetical protein
MSIEDIANDNEITKIKAINKITNKIYETSYDSLICIGELIRNICVNLYIDPDTHDGITRNVYIKLLQNDGFNFNFQNHLPDESLFSLGYFGNKIFHFEFTEIYIKKVF